MTPSIPTCPFSGRQPYGSSRSSPGGSLNSSPSTSQIHDCSMRGGSSIPVLRVHHFCAGSQSAEVGRPTRTPQSSSPKMELEQGNINQHLLGPINSAGYGMFDLGVQDSSFNFPVGLSLGIPFLSSESDLSFSNPESSINSAGHGMPTIRQSPGPETPHTSASNSAWATSLQSVPSHEIISQLVTIFFNVIHPLLPCLHRNRFLADILPGGRLSQPCALLFAVLAISAPMHPDPAVHARSAEWLHLCRQHFEMAIQLGRFSLYNVQAAIWCTFKSFVIADMPPCWIMLGNAYRMAIPLGLHRVDAVRYHSFLPPPTTESQKEERRRIMWAIYRLDRYLSFCCGWPMAIQDKELCTNYPVEEYIFQNSDTMEVCKGTDRYFRASANRISRILIHLRVNPFLPT